MLFSNKHSGKDDYCPGIMENGGSSDTTIIGGVNSGPVASHQKRR